MNLDDTLAAIIPVDPAILTTAQAHQDDLIKPQGSLGLLESLGIQLCGIAGTCPPPFPERAAHVVFAGDHGVHARGVSPWPQEVTQQMAAGIAAGVAGVSALARQVGAQVTVVDVGMICDEPVHPDVEVRKVAHGTADLSTAPAMTREQAVAALEVGIAKAHELVDAGFQILSAGEVGIANTTPAAALIAAFTAAPAAEVTGRGTGVNDETLAMKTAIVQTALDLHQPSADRPIDVLAALGGLEHAAMAGFYLGAASRRVPALIDGVIAASAALAAHTLCPAVTDYLIAGHRSAEPGSRRAIEYLNLSPALDLGLRLGEGTGAVMALPVVQASARVMREMATFSGAGVSTPVE